MKVLLARPHPPNKLSFTGILDNEPLELEYLDTILSQNGYETYIYDGIIETVDFEKTLQREMPEIVCITGYITQENTMLQYGKLSKEYRSDMITVFGGCHVQLNYERFYKEEVDFLSRSECMNTFLELIYYIDPEKKSPPLEEINGIGYRKEGKFHVNELQPADINALPIPNRDFFYKNKEKYRYLDLGEIATIKTAFSCPYDCNFCYCTLLGAGSYRVRDLNLVIEELKGISVKNIQIVDDDFMVDRKRITEFARLLKENHIEKNFTMYARADFMAENPDLVELMAEVGVKYFLVGMEAISDSALQSMNKRTTNEMNLKCIENINKTSAQCIGLFIVNVDATPKDFRDLVDWVKKAKLNLVTVSIFTPILGTPLYEEYKDRIITDKIEDWDFLHLVVKPTKMSKQRFYFEYYKMFLELCRIAKKTGLYDFLDTKYYQKRVGSYLRYRIFKK